jgi:hypothetical protein
MSEKSDSISGSIHTPQPEPDPREWWIPVGPAKPNPYDAYWRARAGLPDDHSLEPNYPGVPVRPAKSAPPHHP